MSYVETNLPRLPRTGSRFGPPLTATATTNLRSRHLEVRWFKVRDYVKNGLLNVLHLRTQYNLADYFTKPLLGNHFQEFRDCIMGVEPETSYFMMQLIKLQSRPIVPNPSCLYVGPGKGS